MKCRRWWCCVFVLVLAPAAVRATTFIPVSPLDLARSSAAVVIGRVAGLTGVESESRGIYTLVEIEIDEVLRGELSAARITLKEDGGKVGDDYRVVFGAPQFRVGERVLLFLTVRPDESLRVNHLALGKFRLEEGDDGEIIARQDLGPGTALLLPSDGAPPAAGVPLRTLRDAVAQVAAESGGAAATEFRLTPPEADDPSLPREVRSEFTLLGEDEGLEPARFFEPDLGQPLLFQIDERGDDTLGFETSRRLVNDAFAAWNDVASASIMLEDGGLTSDLTDACPGPHKVRFNDPFEEIPDQTNCTGTLGVGGFTVLGGIPQSKEVNGATFRQASCGILTLADGWGDCDVWTECNVAEVATHEIGHAIGLGHSSTNDPEPNQTLARATMYFLAHRDGRCAGVRDDDIDGISFIYPTGLPPTITEPENLPSAVFQVPYSVTLGVAGGVGELTWVSAPDQGGFPGLELSSDGVIAGTPTANGSSFFQVKVTDANGNSHTRILLIEVLLNEMTPSPTSPPSSFTPTLPPSFTPSFSPTPTITPTSTPSMLPTMTPTQKTTTPGDADCDGEPGETDVTAAVTALFDPVARALCSGSECNGDGQVNAADLVCVLQSIGGG